MNKDNAEKTEMSSELIPFNRWLRSIGKSRVTGWNWRKQGIVRVTNVFGRIYISRTEIARFEQRATSGEFARCEHRAAPRVKRLSRLRKFFPKLVRRARFRVLLAIVLVLFGFHSVGALP